MTLKSRTAKSPAAPFLTSQLRRERRKRFYLSTILTGPFICLFVGILVGMSGQAILKLILVFGFPYSVLIAVSTPALKKLHFRSYFLTVFVHALYYTAAIAIAFVLMGEGFVWGGVAPHSNSFLPYFSQAPGLVLTISFGFYIWVVLVTFITGVTKKLGPGVIRNWILGYYHTPQIENRIFMFLDMRDSTALAERLGPEKFSSLIRDVFADLSGPVIESRSEVSHYIGDEAVLSWPAKIGLKEGRAIGCFFHFREVLRERGPAYVEKYGVQPSFKAGLHMGDVVATEVGEIKSEIVFHGDVLNTTARIQAECNTLGAELLISEEVRSQLPPLPWLKLTEIGDVELRGKAHAVTLFRCDWEPEA